MFDAVDKEKRRLESVFNESITGSIDDIIKDLPSMLKDPCNVLTNEIEKEVFLIGALGIVSGILPNVLGLYDGSWIGSNLFVYILGEYGGGKGGLKWAKSLAYDVNNAKKEERKELITNYLKDQVEYKKRLVQYKKDKGESDPPNPPQKPPVKMLFIPVNNSKSGVYQLLKENNNRGIMFEWKNR